MGTFAERWAAETAADRRLAILRLLVETGGEAYDGTIEKGLNLLGFRTALTRDVVQADLRLLADAKCVVLESHERPSPIEPDAVMMIATISRLGVAVSRGAETVAGVAKPALGV